MAEERQPDEKLRERARAFRQKCLDEMDERTPAGEWLDVGLMTAFAQSILAPDASIGPRCLVTGNPCGTDTRPTGDPCKCAKCIQAEARRESDELLRDASGATPSASGVASLLKAIDEMRSFITNEHHIPWNNVLHFAEQVRASLDVASGACPKCKHANHDGQNCTVGGAHGFSDDACNCYFDTRVASGVASQDDETRCAICGWPLAELPNKGCIRGNCSMRPMPKNHYSPERAKREAQQVIGEWDAQVYREKP